MKDGELTPRVGKDDHTDGPADAAVTLVEYGDYECPSCGAAYPLLKEIRARMGDQLRFVFRNFPLSEMHPHAEHAAEAAEDAAVHGRFWEMHDTLFEHQRALDDSHLVSYGRKLGLDAREVETALQDGRFESRVQRDVESGERSGVGGTPTFFINGSRFDGDWTNPDEFLGALAQASE
jgi:protein-disulfide isomerase